MTHAHDSQVRHRIAGVANQRKGAIIVLTAILMVVLLSMVAFTVDLGCIMVGRTEMQRAVDSGALAGAGVLGEGATVAEDTARDFVRQNIVRTRPIADSGVDVRIGNWDNAGRSFNEGVEPFNSVRVLARDGGYPLFFARVLGHTQHAIAAQATATFQPRDIMLVLDYSASMNDDSELSQIGRIGRAPIETNLLQIYNELGSPQYGSMRWAPTYIASTDNAVIQATLGLNGVPYPYPRGSWAEYFNYVKNSSVINNAGYRRRYGYLTLVNYWLEQRPMYSETPDLWRTSEQPITAVKDAVAVFLDFVQQVRTDDRVGLVAYTASDGTAVLESGLTSNMTLVEDISRRRQAGHYDHFTNIGAGMQKAREEMDRNGRPGTMKLIVLLTDGLANRPSNPATAAALVRNEAQRSADAEYPIATISLGSGADTSIMQEVADTTGSVHFNVPGGRTVSEYEDQLREVFRQIADDRPLVLVK